RGRVLRQKLRESAEGSGKRPKAHQDGYGRKSERGEQHQSVGIYLLFDFGGCVLNPLNRFFEIFRQDVERLGILRSGCLKLLDLLSNHLISLSWFCWFGGKSRYRSRSHLGQNRRYC